MNKDKLVRILEIVIEVCTLVIMVLPLYQRSKRKV